MQALQKEGRRLEYLEQARFVCLPMVSAYSKVGVGQYNRTRKEKDGDADDDDDDNNKPRVYTCSSRVKENVATTATVNLKDWVMMACTDCCKYRMNVRTYYSQVCV